MILINYLFNLLVYILHAKLESTSQIFKRDPDCLCNNFYDCHSFWSATELGHFHFCHNPGGSGLSATFLCLFRRGKLHHSHCGRTFLALRGGPTPDFVAVVRATGRIGQSAGLLVWRFCAAPRLGLLVAAVAFEFGVWPADRCPGGHIYGKIPSFYEPVFFPINGKTERGPDQKQGQRKSDPEKIQRFPPCFGRRRVTAERANCWWGGQPTNSSSYIIGESTIPTETIPPIAILMRMNKAENEHVGTSNTNSTPFQSGNTSPRKQHYQQQQQEMQYKFVSIEKAEEILGSHKGKTEDQAEHLAPADRQFLEPSPPKLRAIIYAEFDNEIGRVIRYQIPNEIFDKHHFDSISSAIIPSEEMRDRMIKINMFDHKIMGFPVGIKDKKYPREVLIFNMCFIVSKQMAADWVYEPLVQKCAEYLQELEKERYLLSEEKHRLPVLMHEIFTGLNTKGECVYTVTEQTTLYLKLCPTFRGHEPPPVNPLLVPIFTRLPPPTSSMILSRMDVLSQKICPKIDGVRCIKDIACAVQIDSDLVARCIRNLCFYGCIRLLPMFLYFNCYVPTAKLRHFMQSVKMRERCLQFVRLHPEGEGPAFQFTDICRLYLALKHGSTLYEWLQQMGPRELGVDERKLIQFGMAHGFLKLTQIFPVNLQTAEDGTKIASLCNGEFSLQELALHYGCSPMDLHQKLADSGKFRFITR